VGDASGASSTSSAGSGDGFAAGVGAASAVAVSVAEAVGSAAGVGDASGVSDAPPVVVPVSGVGLGGAMVDYARRKSKRNKQTRKAQRTALLAEIEASVRAQVVEEAPPVEVVPQVVAAIRPLLAYDIAPAQIVERLPEKPLLTQELVDRITTAILAEIAANDDEEAAFMLLVA
jgi:hypothetical protein